MIDPFRLFAALQLFAMCTDGLCAEFLLACLAGQRMRPICQLPLSVLVVGLRATRDALDTVIAEGATP